VRVAARIATGRTAEPTQARAQSAGSQAQAVQYSSRAAGKSTARPTAQAGPNLAQASQALGHTAQGVTRGVGGFLRPFRRVGGVLWLEVTGGLFLLPVVVFTPVLWRELANYRHTTDHKTLWLTAAIIAVFLYLGASSFWRARKRATDGR
jgi:hypothetical protein